MDDETLNRQLRDESRRQKARDERNQRIARREFNKLPKEEQEKLLLDMQIKAAEDRGYQKGLKEAEKLVDKAADRALSKLTLCNGQGINCTGNGANWTIALM